MPRSFTTTANIHQHRQSLFHLHGSNDKLKIILLVVSVFVGTFFIYDIYHQNGHEKKSLCHTPLQKPNLETLSSSRLLRYHAVRGAINHAWNGYKNVCLEPKKQSLLRHFLGILPSDDLAPLSKSGIDWLHSAATLYDSLDTLYIAQLEDEFDYAKRYILSLPLPTFATKTFEYSIRVIGGLLGAHSISGDTDFLVLAKRHTDSILEGAFESSPTALPRMYDIVAPSRHLSFSSLRLWNLSGYYLHRCWGKVWRFVRDHMNEHATNSLAGVGSFSLEFVYLSHKTGNDDYIRAADDIFRHVTDKDARTSNDRSSNLVPSSWNVISGKSISRWTSLGSGSDSFYEYLIKIPILLRMSMNEDKLGYQQLFHQVIHESFLSKSSRHIRRSYGDQNNEHDHLFPVDNMDIYQHLLCYLPGTILLAGNHTKEYYSKYLNLAEKLMDGCQATYYLSKTGLGAEKIQIKSNNLLLLDKGYYLRPEFVESIFILYRTTKDERYQDIAWDVFTSIEEHCKMDIGYSGLLDVDNENQRKDEQPSFFIGETLKYLLLTFAPDDYLDLDDYVFTTEAHPFRKVGKDLSDQNCKMSDHKILQPISIFFSMVGNAFTVSILILCWRSKRLTLYQHKKVH